MVFSSTNSAASVWLPRWFRRAIGLVNFPSWVEESSRPVESHHQPLTDSVREPLDSYGSCQSSSWVFAVLNYTPWVIVPPGRPVDWYSLWIDPSPSLHGLLSPLHRYYWTVRPLHLHRYFPPSFALIGFSLSIRWRVPAFHTRAWISFMPPLCRTPFRQ